MSMLGNAAKFHRLLRIGRRNEGLSLLLRDSPRCFSTEAEQPSPEQFADAFLRTPRSPNTGVVFGKLLPIDVHTTKSDIVSLLEGCGLRLDDLKVDYARFLTPTGMMIRFHSEYAFHAAYATIRRKIRGSNLVMCGSNEWDRVTPYDGKAVLLQGIPRNALIDDIERFLSGCMYDASTLRIFVSPGVPDPIRMAVVHFPSKAQANHAFLTKNRSFCLNNLVSVRVLH